MNIDHVAPPSHSEIESTPSTTDMILCRPTKLRVRNHSRCSDELQNENTNMFLECLPPNFQGEKFMNKTLDNITNSDDGLQSAGKQKKNKSE